MLEGKKRTRQYWRKEGRHGGGVGDRGDMEEGSEIQETEQDWRKKSKRKISYKESDSKKKDLNSIRGNKKGDKTVSKEGKETKRR